MTTKNDDATVIDRAQRSIDRDDATIFDKDYGSVEETGMEIALSKF